MKLEPWETLVKALAEIWAEEDIRAGVYTTQERSENSTTATRSVDIGSLPKYPESTMRSITFEKLKAKTEADPSYRPSHEEIDQIKAEWRAFFPTQSRFVQDSPQRCRTALRLFQDPLPPKYTSLIRQQLS